MAENPLFTLPAIGTNALTMELMILQRFGGLKQEQRDVFYALHNLWKEAQPRGRHSQDERTTTRSQHDRRWVIPLRFQSPQWERHNWSS